MAHRLHRKTLAVGLTAAVSLGTGMAAFAYWSASGSGTGSASSTAGESVTITQTGTVNDLEPGQTTPDTLVGTLTVSNGMYAYVGTITPTVTGTSSPGCSASDFTVAASTYDQEVQGSATGVTLGTIVFNDTSSDQDACKGVTVDISYSSNGGVPAALVSSIPSAVVGASATSGLLPGNSAPTSEYSPITQVSCPADGFCVGVGNYEDTGYSQDMMVDTLSGGSWTSIQVPTPFVTGSDGFQTNGISCATTTSCVIVGTLTVLTTPSTAIYVPIIFSWDGATWSYSSPAMPSSYDYNQSNGGGTATLAGVSCATATSCVAVGSYSSYTPGGRDSILPLVETLSSGTWTPTSPGLGSNAPNPSSAYVWAPLTGVSCSSVSFCEALGGYVSPGGHSTVETLTSNGTRWTVGTVPAISGDYGEYPGPISCPSDGNCVMIGTYEASTGITTTMTETLSGGTWSETDIATPAGAAIGMFPQAISCTSLNSCMSVGFYFTPTWSQNEVTATLDSGGWTVSAFTGTNKPTPESVSCPSTSSCEITGLYNQPDANSNFLPLAEPASIS